MKPTLAASRSKKGNFVCPWCGATFAYRSIADDPTSRVANSLERHWQQSAVCGRQKNVSNQTQSKYQEFGAERIVPGEATLRLVASRDTVGEDA